MSQLRPAVQAVGTNRITTPIDDAIVLMNNIEAATAFDLTGLRAQLLVMDTSVGGFDFANMRSSLAVLQNGMALLIACAVVPPGTLVLDLWLSVLCMRSKAWLAVRVSLRLARLPRAASSA